MSFDFSTLVTDRTQADVNRVKEIAEKIKNGTASESELAEFNSSAMKGAYNHTDLNRVTAAMEDLKLRLESYGYAVPGYQKIEVPHPMTGGGSRLPEGYIELSWIESTGTQYVDTEFYPKYNSRVVLEVSDIPARANYLFGTRSTLSSTAALQFGFYRSGSTTIRTDYFGANKSATVSNTTTKATIDMNGNTTSAYGQTITHNSVNSGTCTYPLFLFALNSVGTAEVLSSAKLYSCQIYDNGTLVRDYIPCINQSGDVGLFDMVTAVFFGNSGTGVFFAGERMDVVLPSGYTRLTYIESTGSQYVDTGINASVGTKAIVSFQATSTPTSNWWILSAVISGTVLWRAGVNASTFRSDAGFTYSQTSSLTARTTANGVCTVNMNIPLYLFAQNEGGAVEFGKFKLYSCQLYNGETLVRDYVPCKNASGTLGLYDMANGVFYQNAGSGAFTAGEEIAPPTDVPSEEFDPYLWYEFDWPTPQAMTVYLLNVSAIRAVLDVMESTPQVPDDMVGLMVTEANNIEVILRDVYRQINIMATTFIPCGEALCGGDNL